MSATLALTNDFNVEQMEQVARKIVIEELSKESKHIREDFILVFGVFASLLIFASSSNQKGTVPVRYR